MRLITVMSLLGLGVAFWLWGTLWIPGRRSILWKLHALGVSDTLGSLLIVSGLLVHSPSHWRELSVAFISIVFWGTMLSFVLARAVSRRERS
jgi:multicomponent Na+:H+ antiporter subunit G